MWQCYVEFVGRRQKLRQVFTCRDPGLFGLYNFFFCVGVCVFLGLRICRAPLVTWSECCGKCIVVLRSTKPAGDPCNWYYAPLHQHTRALLSHLKGSKIMRWRFLDASSFLKSVSMIPTISVHRCSSVNKEIDTERADTQTFRAYFLAAGSPAISSSLCLVNYQYRMTKAW